VKRLKLYEDFDFNDDDFDFEENYDIDSIKELWSVLTDKIYELYSEEFDAKKIKIFSDMGSKTINVSLHDIEKLVELGYIFYDRNDKSYWFENDKYWMINQIVGNI